MTVDRRGRPIQAASYWSARERNQRAAIFSRRESGMSVRAIAEELGLTPHDVEAVLLSDRRRRST